MSTTARHAHPPAPPREREPFIRGPFPLELALSLVFTLIPIWTGMVIIYRWVYVVDNAPGRVLLGLAGICLAAVVGWSLMAWIFAVRVASWAAAGAVLAELAARRAARWALGRVRVAGDRGSANVVLALVVATVVAAIVLASVIALLLSALFGRLDDTVDEQLQQCLAGCTSSAPRLVYTGTDSPAVVRP